MGMSGIDEKAMMLQALEEVAGVTKLPLSIDSSHVDVQEEALRRYPGRALINSISLESEKFEKLLPLAKKYGAMFVLLPLSDEGLPKNLNEKISIIEKIVARALGLGHEKDGYYCGRSGGDGRREQTGGVGNVGNDPVLP